jgi:hypothetical protein
MPDGDLGIGDTVRGEAGVREERTMIGSTSTGGEASRTLARRSRPTVSR